MIKFVLGVVTLDNTNEKIRDLSQIENEANAFVKDPKVKALDVLPMIQVVGEQLVVGAMINWELTPR